MGAVLKFRPKVGIADVEFVGGEGFFSVCGKTDAGIAFLKGNVQFESWQGSAAQGIAIDNTDYAMEIAKGALDQGCRVLINGKEI